MLPVLSITEKNYKIIQPDSTNKTVDAVKTGSSRKRRVAIIVRWLHIYVSMISFAIVFFFAATGLTLNHAEKFAGKFRTVEEKGQLNADWVKTSDTSKIRRLEIVEHLRTTNKIKAALSEFNIDDAQVTVSFKGPGYSADAFIDRETGKYDLTKTMAGFTGIMNDLHKGRDTGPVWSAFIDAAAILMVLVSLTGMLLLLYIKRKRVSGLVVAAVGLLIAYIIFQIWVK